MLIDAILSGTRWLINLPGAGSCAMVSDVNGGSHTDPISNDWLSTPLIVFTADQLDATHASCSLPEFAPMSTTATALQAMFPEGSAELSTLCSSLDGAFPEYAMDGPAHARVHHTTEQLLAWCMKIPTAALLCRPPPPLLDFLEFFAGDAQLSKAMSRLGLLVKSFDIKYSAPTKEAQDLLDPLGFRYALVAVLFAARHADLWAGIVCSSWVWMSRGTTKRKADRQHIWGDTSVRCVRVGNALAIRVTYLCFMMANIGGFWCIEQPMTSLLWHFPPMAKLLETSWHGKTSTYLGTFGADTSKPIHICHTSPWMLHLRRKRLQMHAPAQLVKRDRLGRVSGLSVRLKCSQAYLEGFGIACAHARMACFEDRKTDDLPQGVDLCRGCHS